MSSTSLEDIIKVNNEKSCSMDTTPTTIITNSHSHLSNNGAIDENEKNLSKSENLEIVRNCGWFDFNPKCLQRFMTPKWALFWLCWAGAVQGEFEFEENNISTT